MIEQLEQIRNLSAATDNSITSDQKMEARKKVRIFYEMENISRFFLDLEKKEQDLPPPNKQEMV